MMPAELAASINGSGAASAAPAPVLPIFAGPTGSEAPASVTVKLRYRGHDVMLTLRDATGRDALERLDGALTWLEAHGAAPAAGAGPGSDPSAPLCPVHGAPMKPSQHGGFYCPAKISEDGGNGRPVYCRHKES